jgi:hypothetical protein
LKSPRETDPATGAAVARKRKLYSVPHRRALVLGSTAYVAGLVQETVEAPVAGVQAAFDQISPEW